MNNEYTRKEKPCFLSNGEFCDKEDKNCDRCIAAEEQHQYESVYTHETVTVFSRD